jgi:hypothetical protein
MRGGRRAEFRAVTEGLSSAAPGDNLANKG